MAWDCGARFRIEETVPDASPAYSAMAHRVTRSNFFSACCVRLIILSASFRVSLFRFQDRWWRGGLTWPHPILVRNSHSEETGRDAAVWGRAQLFRCKINLTDCAREVQSKKPIASMKHYTS